MILEVPYKSAKITKRSEDSTGDTFSKDQEIWQDQEIWRNHEVLRIEAKPPFCKDGLQSLLGHLDYIRRFISILAEKVQVFTDLLKLKQEGQFRREQRHQEAFEEIRRYLTIPPVLMPPSKGRPPLFDKRQQEVDTGKQSWF